MRELQIFLIRCGNNPFIKSDGLFWAFLSSGKAAWEAHRAASKDVYQIEFQEGRLEQCAAQVVGPMVPAAVPLEGAVRWVQMVNKVEADPAIETVMQGSLRMAQVMTKQMQEFAYAGRRMAEHAAGLAKEASTFVEAFKEVAKSDEGLRDGTAWPCKHGPSLADLSTQCSKGFEATVPLLHRQRLALDSLLVQFISYEYHASQALEALLTNRANLKAQLDKLKVDGSRKPADQAKVEALTTQLAFVSKGIRSYELDRWVRDRLKSMRECMASVGLAMTPVADTQALLWRRIGEAAIPASIRGDDAKRGSALREAEELSRSAMHAMAKTVIPDLVGGPKGTLDQLDDGLRAMDALPSLPPGLMPGGAGIRALEAPEPVLPLPAPEPAAGGAQGGASGSGASSGAGPRPGDPFGAGAGSAGAGASSSAAPGDPFASSAGAGAGAGAPQAAAAAAQPGDPFAGGAGSSTGPAPGAGAGAGAGADAGNPFGGGASSQPAAQSQPEGGHGGEAPPPPPPAGKPPGSSSQSGASGGDMPPQDDGEGETNPFADYE